MKSRCAMSSVPRCSSSRRRTSTSRALSAAAIAHLLEQAPGDLARQRGLAAHDAAEELDDAVGRFALEQIAGGAAADRGEQVLLGSRRGQDDDL
jgi:hypothetical protein